MRRCHLRFPNRRICGLHPLVEDGEHACSGHRVWHVSQEFQPVPGPDGSARNVFRANPIAQRSPTAMDNANTQQVGQDRPSHHQPGAGGGYCASRELFTPHVTGLFDAALRHRDTQIMPLEPREHKRLRCGLCIGCTRQDCGVCISCKDKPKFNGPGAFTAAATPIPETEIL